MLVSFSIENWMSFRQEAILSLYASQERRHSQRLPSLKNYRLKLLPVSAVYGGNASGKSNFFKALEFAKYLVVEGTKPDDVLRVQPFLLDAESSQKPTKFSFVILTSGIEVNKNNKKNLDTEALYEFTFSLNSKSIVEEKLVEIKPKSKENFSDDNEEFIKNVIYSRGHNEKTTFSQYLQSLLPPEKLSFLNFVAEGTRGNQLFLTNAIQQNVELLRPIYNWFKFTLNLMSPHASFEFVEQNYLHPEYWERFAHFLSSLDTGITKVDLEDLPFLDGYVLWSEVPHSEKGRFVFVHDKEKKIVFYHKKYDKSLVKFEFHQESDGTQRLVDLVPIFLELSNETQTMRKVWVIDEFDRSLHTKMTRALLESFLSHCNKDSRAQLLFTTHDVSLMDLKLLRCDEMWLVERLSAGESKLFSVVEYKEALKDKKLAQSYLQGRMGGIPHIVLPNK